jgi:Tfp pilus assembly protein PilX
MRERPSNFVPRRRGFVLLVTLVLLTLAALAAVAVSRAALARGMAAREAQIQLQRRWGTLSCQAALLPRTDAILRQNEARLQQPQVGCQTSLILGDQTFDLVFMDESAKASATELIQRQGKIQAEETIRRLSVNSPAAGNIHLRWGPGREGPESFGEIFDNANSDSLCNRTLGPAPADVLTCWGDGRMNIHRGSEVLMREVLSGALDLIQIHRIAELQKTKPPVSLAKVLDQLQLTQQKRALAEKLLADSSNCFSLWTTCHTARRTYCDLAVVDYSRIKVGQVRCFAW